MAAAVTAAAVTAAASTTAAMAVVHARIAPCGANATLARGARLSSLTTPHLSTPRRCLASCAPDYP
eukprot:scaffold5451_cov33-Phaeocystis_antarctica.AAC.1